MAQGVVLFVSLVTFVATLLIGTLVWWAWVEKRASARSALAQRIGVQAPAAAELLLLRGTQESPLRWLRTQLDRAGDTRGERGFLIQSAVFGLVGLAGGVVGGIAAGHGVLGGLGLLAGAIPLLLLRRRGDQRSLSLTLLLPDALDCIARTLRSGHAFSEALRVAGGEQPPPIGEELLRVSEKHRLGISMEDCLESLVVRNSGNFDISLFVGAVQLHRETGGNMVEMLDHMAEMMREQQTFKQKVKALTAEVRMSAVILGVLPFLVTGALAVMQPNYLLPLIQTSLGNKLLGVAVASLVLAGVVMRRLARVEV